MSKSSPIRSFFRLALLAAIAVSLGTPAPAAPIGGADKPEGEPARVSVEVSPAPVKPGGEGEVVVRIVPEDGIKINRYPKIKLTVPAREGLVAGGEAAVGNDSPPDPDRMSDNYFGKVDPVRLRLRIDPAAATGDHRVGAKLLYYYCVSASGYCAPKRVSLEIPINVR